MKTSAATALFVLANGIAAMPWLTKHNSAKGFYDGQEVTIHVEVDGATAKMGHKGHLGSNTFQICLRMCAYDELYCPDGWESEQFGDCYTCCKIGS